MRDLMAFLAGVLALVVLQNPSAWPVWMWLGFTGLVWYGFRKGEASL